MPSKKHIQSKIRETEKQVEELKQMFEEHYKEPYRRTLVGDIAHAWTNLNKSIGVEKRCYYCGKILLHNLRLYCACGHAFCSAQCSDKFHKERRESND